MLGNCRTTSAGSFHALLGTKGPPDTSKRMTLDPGASAAQKKEVGPAPRSALPRTPTKPLDPTTAIVLLAVVPSIQCPFCARIHSPLRPQCYEERTLSLPRSRSGLVNHAMLVRARPTPCGAIDSLPQKGRNWTASMPSSVHTKTLSLSTAPGTYSFLPFWSASLYIPRKTA